MRDYSRPSRASVQRESQGTKRFVCSTQNVSPEYWRDAACAYFPGLTVDWLADHPIQARVETCAFADAQVIEIINSPARLARLTPPGGDDCYWLILQLAGSTGYVRAGRDRLEAVQDIGDLVLLDPGLPFDGLSLLPAHLVVWDLPRDTLAPLLTAPEQRLGLRKIRGASGLGTVLGTYVRSLMCEADRLDAEVQRSLRVQLCDLVAMALGTSRSMQEKRHETHRVARRQQILAYVETHLRNADLTADRAASDLGMSVRWLHMLLDEQGMSFAAWVARRRLEECLKSLVDPARDHLTVTEIAFLNGFNDVSTFNRRFRSHYGMTPREARGRRTAPMETT